MGARLLWLGTSSATGGATVGFAGAGVDGSAWDPVGRAPVLQFLRAGAVVATGRHTVLSPGGGVVTIACHGRFLQFLPVQQLEHSRPADLHSQTARGSAPQVANLVHWQHLRTSAVLWRRRRRGLEESIDRSGDRLLRMVVSGVGPFSVSRAASRSHCCALATSRKCAHIGTALPVLGPVKNGRST